MKENWGPGYHDAVVEAGRAGSLLKQMLFIFHLISSLPVWLQMKLSPGMEPIRQVRKLLSFDPLLLMDVQCSWSSK